MYPHHHPLGNHVLVTTGAPVGGRLPSWLAVVLSLSMGGGSWAADPWADAVVDASENYTGAELYDDPESVLGEPSTTFYDPFAGAQFIVSLVAGPFNLSEPDGEKLITTINADQFIKVRFDEPVEDDPFNPFGVDLLVFGNAFLAGVGGVTPETDMDSYTITNPAGILAEPITVAVSPSGVGDPTTHPQEWYVYADGPYADALYPTNAFRWDRDAGDWGEALDFTKPVDPNIELQGFSGLAAADAIALYGRSGGGTGFDLAETGFEAIQFVYLTGTGGEIDALADVSPDVSWQQFHGTASHVGVWPSEIRSKATVFAWSAGTEVVRVSQPA
ncbi:MAG: hypothetical protein IID39_02025, partial [Planctomycetes bacterium]|nr:hypothetical protein [Planctomycetota bacterium]